MMKKKMSVKSGAGYVLPKMRLRIGHQYVGVFANPQAQCGIFQQSGKKPLVGFVGFWQTPSTMINSLSLVL